MDNLDIYVFENWYDGEVIDGPNIDRYWVTITLAFPINEMPDTQGAIRMIKHGAKVKYKKAFRKFRDDSVPSGGGKRRPSFTQEEVWIVTITIPRQFIEELDDEDLELYDAIVDIEDISDARDENIDEQTPYEDGGQDSGEEIEGEDDENI